jgi:FKBP-type peptidyl-prolyl cis-trans isomerase
MAYGANPPGPPIEPNSMLVFEVELLGVDGK